MTPTIHVGLTDEFDPEVQAMMLAMYSRSYGPIADRLPTTEQEKLELKEKLSKFYVGYNHKSVGQLGVTTIWFEGVSQLAAKAIENHPLYNGQESSTRYVDYSSQPMVDAGVEEIHEWQEKWRAFYIKALPLVTEKIKAEYPYVGDVTMSVYNNTVKARAFDICRGFLPAGCVTNVGFMGTFDTLNDHFGEMLFHPLAEMREIAETALTELAKKYSYAAIPIEKLKERFDYVDFSHFYSGPNKEHVDPGDLHPPLSMTTWGAPEQHMLSIERKKFEKFPRIFSSKYRFVLCDQIDFGSYRDIHRHRNGVISMPMLGVNIGMNDFYIDNLPAELIDEIENLTEAFEMWYEASSITGSITGSTMQYAVPMGYLVDFSYDCDLNQLLYIMELRSGKTVHQTLRRVIHRAVNALNKKFPELVVHADMDEENFSLKRGTQTFIEP